MLRRIAGLSDQVKIASVAGFCLIGLTVVLKNVLDVPQEILSRHIVIYIALYSGFWLLPSLGDPDMKKAKLDRPLFWSLLILAITVAIIAVYTI